MAIGGVRLIRQRQGMGVGMTVMVQTASEPLPSGGFDHDRNRAQFDLGLEVSVVVGRGVVVRQFIVFMNVFVFDRDLSATEAVSNTA